MRKLAKPCVRSLSVGGTQPHGHQNLAPHPAVLVGIANLPLLDAAEALEALRQRAARLSEEFDRLRRHPRRQIPAPPHVDAIFDYGVSALHAELAWARRTIELLEVAHGGH